MENQKTSEKLLLVIGLALVLIKKRRQITFTKNNNSTTTTTNVDSTNLKFTPTLSEIIPSLLQTLPLKLTTSACIKFDIEVLMCEMKINYRSTNTNITNIHPISAHQQQNNKEIYGNNNHNHNHIDNILQSLIKLNMNRVELNQLSKHIQHRILQKSKLDDNNNYKFMALLRTLSTLLCIPTKIIEQSNQSENTLNHIFIEDSIDITVLVIEAIHHSILHLCSNTYNASSSLLPPYNQSPLNNTNSLVTAASTATITGNRMMMMKMMDSNKKYISVYERMGDLCSLLATSLRQLKNTTLLACSNNNYNHNKDNIKSSNAATATTTTTSFPIITRSIKNETTQSNNNRNETTVLKNHNGYNQVEADDNDDALLFITSGMREWMIQLLAQGVSCSDTASWPLVQAMYSSLAEELLFQ